MKIAIQTDHHQAFLISKVLSSAGTAYQCHIDTFVTAENWHKQLAHKHFDMLIVDRQNWQTPSKTPTSVPILFLLNVHDAEHEDDEGDNVATLASFTHQGVHDYMVMPLRHQELLLRVQILLQRAYPTSPRPKKQARFVQFEHYVFDTRAISLTINGQAIATPLTKKEFELALLFFNNLNRPLSRAYIQETIWGHETDLPSRTIDTHVSRVRNKLQCNLASNPDLVTVYGYGYCLQQKVVKT